MEKQDYYFVLNNDFLNWRWFHNPKIVSVFLFLLVEASPCKTFFEEREIKRGSLVTKNRVIADVCGLTMQNVRTALANLEKTGEITREVTNRYQIITINNYESYRLDS